MCVSLFHTRVNIWIFWYAYVNITLSIRKKKKKQRETRSNNSHKESEWLWEHERQTNIGINEVKAFARWNSAIDTECMSEKKPVDSRQFILVGCETCGNQHGKICKITTTAKKNRPKIKSTEKHNLQKKNVNYSRNAILNKMQINLTKTKKELQCAC